MQLRIHRTFGWMNISDTYGGQPVWSLQTYDTLQYLDQEGEWVDVPIVEGEMPLNPDQQKLANDLESLKEVLHAEDFSL